MCSMPKRLPKEVMQFLIDNPKELATVVEMMKTHRTRVEAEEADRKWHESINERYRNAKTVPCGVYGCTEPKNEMDWGCNGCKAECAEDPDAFK